MANFWAGVGQGFSGGFKTGWETAAERDKLEEAAKREKDKLIANITAKGREIKALGGDPYKELTGAPEFIWQKPFSEIASSQPDDAQLAFDAGSKGVVEKLKLEREKQKEHFEGLGSDLVSLITGEVEMPEGLTSQQQDWVEKGASNRFRTATQDIENERASNYNTASSMFNEIHRITGQAKPDISNLDHQDLYYWTSNDGVKQLQLIRDTVYDYVQVMGEIPEGNFSVNKISETKNALDINRNALADLKQKGFSNDSEEYQKIIRANTELRKELGLQESERTFNIPAMNRKIEKRLNDIENNAEYEKRDFNINKAEAQKRTDKFMELYVPRDHENIEVPLVSGEKDGKKVKLWKQVYFERKFYPEDDKKWYWDVKDTFRSFNNEYRDIIPSDIVHKSGKTTLMVVNPASVRRSVIYRRKPVLEQGEGGETPLKPVVDPSSKDAKDPKLVGDLKRPSENPDEITPAQKAEREEVWAEYGFNPDGTRKEDTAPLPAVIEDKEIEEKVEEKPFIPPSLPTPELEAPEVNPFSDSSPQTKSVDEGEILSDIERYPESLPKPFGPEERKDSIIGIAERARLGDKLAEETLRNAVSELTEKENVQLRKARSPEDQLRIIEIGLKRFKDK